MNKKKVPEENNSLTYQTLALFIILLSFFIILNSISSFDEQKSSPIMQSIEDAFTSKIFKDDIAPSQSPDQLKLAGEGHAVEQLDNLFKSTFPQITETRVDTERGRFYAELPLKVFQHKLENLGESDFFKRVIKMSNKNNDALRLEIYNLHPKSIGELFQNTPENLEENRRFLSGVAASLGKAGLPTSNMTIGFDYGKKDTVRLIISEAYTYNPAAPKSSAQGGAQ